MAKTRTLVFCLVAGLSGYAFLNPAHATSCDAIVGKWSWFTGGVVTIDPNGRMIHEPGNDGTWECTDPFRVQITMRWRLGEFINSLALSADGRTLSSTDPSQSFVTATRIGVPASAQPSNPKVAAEAKAHFNEGLDYYNIGANEEAIDEFTTAIEISPNYAAAYNGRGASYADDGQYDQAISDYTKAIELNPKFADAYNNRGLIYANEDQYDQAISDYTKAIEIDPNHPKAYNNRAASYYYKGDYDGAWEDVRKAEDLGNPAKPEFLDKLRQASRASKSSSQEVAPEDAQEIVRLVERIDHHSGERDRSNYWRTFPATRGWFDR